MIEEKFIIGITGNIATGKSVLRRMLANCGALGIDADVLAHRMYYPGGLAFQPILDAFGNEVLSDDRTISTKKLGEIVFADPERLITLESIVHPLVIDTILSRAKASPRPLVVIEAIKLLESGLDNNCDQIWVSDASQDHQIHRLLAARGMTEADARTRIAAQRSQVVKLLRADVIIRTEGSFTDTWHRTQKALNDTIESTEIEIRLHINSSDGWSIKSVNNLSPQQLNTAWQELAQEDVTSLHKHLGMERVFPILFNDCISAFVIWEDWNFTATLRKVYPIHVLQDHPEWVFDAFETYVRLNQVESLLLIKTFSDTHGLDPRNLGFMEQQVDQISYPAWRLAGQKITSPTDPNVWMKVLTQPFELQNATRI
jgi:dephospho-CoA kinase